MTCDGSCAEPNCRNGMPLIDWDNPIAEPEPIAETPIHLCPPGREARFPCCGRYVQELLSHRMTLDPDRVTCNAQR